MGGDLILEHFPIDTQRDNLNAEVAARLKNGALSCRFDEQDKGFLMMTVMPSFAMIEAELRRDQSNGAETRAAATLAKVAVAQADPSLSLGSLSRKYESGGKPGAIGVDGTGGPSYGLYQIATRTGTMASFLAFLERTRPDFAAKLTNAGGADAARIRDPQFVAAWKELAADPQFSIVQHGFIKATHYDPFTARLRIEQNLDLETFEPVIHDVAWSTAVQHGPGNQIFDRALSSLGGGSPTARALVDAIYDERSKVDIYFRRSTPNVQAAIKQRFAQERADATALLLA